jgi:hypothetical protein
MVGLGRVPLRPGDAPGAGSVLGSIPAHGAAHWPIPAAAGAGRLLVAGRVRGKRASPHTGLGFAASPEGEASHRPAP